LNAIQTVLSILAGNRRTDCCPMSEPVQAKVREILVRRTAATVVFPREYCGSGEEGWWTSYNRTLPGCGREVTDIHVVNEDVHDVVSWVENFLAIDGEVCFSQLGDSYYHTRKTFLGVVISGKLIAGYDVDVWSSTCPMTGRRIIGPRDGSARTEDWLVPMECRLVRVLTSDREFLKELDIAGIPAELWVTPVEDPREWDMASDWDADWA